MFVVPNGGTAPNQCPEEQPQVQHADVCDTESKPELRNRHRRATCRCLKCYRLSSFYSVQWESNYQTIVILDFFT